MTTELSLSVSPVAPVQCPPVPLERKGWSRRRFPVMVHNALGIYDPLYVLINQGFWTLLKITWSLERFSQAPKGSQRCEMVTPQRFRRASVSVRSSRRERLNSGYGCRLTLGRTAHAWHATEIPWNHSMIGIGKEKYYRKHDFACLKLFEHNTSCWMSCKFRQSAIQLFVGTNCKALEIFATCSSHLPGPCQLANVV